MAQENLDIFLSLCCGDSALEDEPELVNSDPYGDGWMFKLRLSEPDQLGDLLDADAYAEVMADDEH